MTTSSGLQYVDTNVVKGGTAPEAGPGLLVGRYSGYWNTGKGSTWEGGIHEAAFAYW